MDLDCCLDFILFFLFGGMGGGGGNRSQFYNQIKTRHVFMEMTMKCRHALQIWVLNQQFDLDQPSHLQYKKEAFTVNEYTFRGGESAVFIFISLLNACQL